MAVGKGRKEHDKRDKLKKNEAGRQIREAVRSLQLAGRKGMHAARDVLFCPAAPRAAFLLARRP